MESASAASYPLFKEDFPNCKEEWIQFRRSALGYSSCIKHIQKATWVKGLGKSLAAPLQKFYSLLLKHRPHMFSVIYRGFSK